MRRLRFSSGLIIGLLIGVPAGTIIGLLVLPTRPADQGAVTSLQVQELTRKLEAAQEAKFRADQQLEQFTKLAEQMTASFNSLEQRFKALEEENRRQQARGSAPPAAQPAGAAPQPASPPGGSESAPDAADSR